jgi:hypothetical protein
LNFIHFNFQIPVFFLSVFAIVSSQYVYDPANPPNYCAFQSTLCMYSIQNHIACGNNGEFSANCPANREVVPMTAARIQVVLDVHNSLRSKLALGQLTGGLNGASFPTAARMATISWNQELADFALINAKQCVEKGDYCHNTVDFKFPSELVVQRIQICKCNEHPKT